MAARLQLPGAGQVQYRFTLPPEPIVDRSLPVRQQVLAAQLAAMRQQAGHIGVAGHLAQALDKGFERWQAGADKATELNAKAEAAEAKNRERDAKVLADFIGKTLGTIPGSGSGGSGKRKQTPSEMASAAIAQEVRDARQYSQNIGPTEDVAAGAARNSFIYRDKGGTPESRAANLVTQGMIQRYLAPDAPDHQKLAMLEALSEMDLDALTLLGDLEGAELGTNLIYQKGQGAPATLTDLRGQLPEDNYGLPVQVPGGLITQYLQPQHVGAVKRERSVAGKVHATNQGNISPEATTGQWYPRFRWTPTQAMKDLRARVHAENKKLAGEVLAAGGTGKRSDLDDAFEAYAAWRNFLGEDPQHPRYQTRLGWLFDKFRGKHRKASDVASDEVASSGDAEFLAGLNEIPVRLGTEVDSDPFGVGDEAFLATLDELPVRRTGEYGGDPFGVGHDEGDFMVRIQHPQRRGKRVPGLGLPGRERQIRVGREKVELSDSLPNPAGASMNPQWDAKSKVAIIRYMKGDAVERTVYILPSNLTEETIRSLYGHDPETLKDILRVRDSSR